MMLTVSFVCKKHLELLKNRMHYALTVRKIQPPFIEIDCKHIFFLFKILITFIEITQNMSPLETTLKIKYVERKKSIT
jgi:hypothetical protein